MPTTLDELLTLSNDDLFEIVQRGAPLDLDALADTTYTGIDLSMPALFHRLFWKTFRKTFHRDTRSGKLRGWNVKVEQTGYAAPPEPRRDRRGRPRERSLARLGSVRTRRVRVPLSDFWVLVREGPLAPEDVVPRPDGR